MLLDGVLIGFLILMASGGSILARRGLGIPGACGHAAGLCLSLSVFLFIALATLNIGGVPLWFNLLASVFVIAGLALWSVRRPEPQPLAAPFKRWHLILLSCIFVVTLAYLKVNQLITTEDDFWIHFPEANHFLFNNSKPRNPYFPEFALQGHYGRDLMLASFSLLLGRDVQRTQWILEFVLLSNSFFLWCLTVRRLSGSALAATLSTVLVFTGVNVGSRIGLMTTYDNNNVLVYLLLGAVLLVYWELLHRGGWPLLVAAGFLTAVHASVYETNCVVAIATLAVTAALRAWWDPEDRRPLARRFLIVISIGLCLTLLQGGILTSLSKRAWQGFQHDVESLAEQNVSLQVSLSFPKREFLQIRLGPEHYQRYSVALDTLVLRGLRPTVDEGGYSFIFGPRVLVIHWFATWLAPFCLYWAWRRRRLDALMVGSFGVVAFVTPGLFHFGPLFEGEYLRWQVAAGVGFSLLLGLAIAELVSRKRNLVIPLVLFFILNSLAAEKAINDLGLQLSREPGAAERALRLWYPPTDEWFTSLPALRFTSDDLEAVRWLQAHALPGDRTLSDFESQNHNSMLREAAIGGLSGTYMVGHELPAPWTPYATAPYLPSSATMAFRQTADPTIAAGIGADWLYLSNEATKPTGLEPAFRSQSGLVEIYSLEDTTPSTPLLLPDGSSTALEARISSLPEPDRVQSGAAFPVELHFTEALHGWITPALLDSEGRLINRLAPIVVAVAGKEARAWYVPPIEEGEFTIQWLFSEGTNWQRLGEPQPSAYRFTEPIEELLTGRRIGTDTIKVENRGSRLYDPGQKVKLLWRVWDLIEDEYRLLIPEGERDIDLRLQPGQSLTFTVDLGENLPDHFRVDYFLSAQVGPLVPLITGSE